jgi:hypothetical protein
MSRSSDEQFLHDWVIRSIKDKYGRLYKEVHINPGDEKNFEFKGRYPDAVFVNYGQVVLIVEVETRETVNEGEVEEWKDLSGLGVKLSIVVPKDMQNSAREICWKCGLAGKVNIGYFGVELNV